MPKKNTKSYTDAYKQKVLKSLRANGGTLTIAQAAEKFSVSAPSINNWKKAAGMTRSTNSSRKSKSVKQLRAERARLDQMIVDAERRERQATAGDRILEICGGMNASQVKKVAGANKKLAEAINDLLG